MQCSTRLEEVDEGAPTEWDGQPPEVPRRLRKHAPVEVQGVAVQAVVQRR
jgi:hypothetical protein